MRRCSLEQSKWSWDECHSICINTRKNNGSSRVWVGDDQEVFTGAVRVKFWEVEGWSRKTTVVLSVSIQEWTTVPAGCEWAMIRRCSLEQSEWSPEKLKVEAGRRLSFYLYQYKNEQPFQQDMSGRWSGCEWAMIRMWVGDDQEVFTGAVRVKSWEVEVKPEDDCRFICINSRKSDREVRKKTYNGGARNKSGPDSQSQRCSLEHSEWSPAKLNERGSEVVSSLVVLVKIVGKLNERGLREF